MFSSRCSSLTSNLLRLLSFTAFLSFHVARSHFFRCITLFFYSRLSPSTLTVLVSPFPLCLFTFSLLPMLLFFLVSFLFNHFSSSHSMSLSLPLTLFTVPLLSTSLTLSPVCLFFLLLIPSFSSLLLFLLRLLPVLLPWLLCSSWFSPPPLLTLPPSLPTCLSPSLPPSRPPYLATTRSLPPLFPASDDAVKAADGVFASDSGNIIRLKP